MTVSGWSTATRYRQRPVTNTWLGRQLRRRCSAAHCASSAGECSDWDARQVEFASTRHSIYVKLSLSDLANKETILPRDAVL